MGVRALFEANWKPVCLGMFSCGDADILAEKRAIPGDLHILKQFHWLLIHRTDCQAAFKGGVVTCTYSRIGGYGRVT